MGRRSSPRTQVQDLEILWDYFTRHQVPLSTGCVAWTAGRHSQGYGMIGAWRSDGTKIMTLVHRIVARIKYARPIVKEEMVIHTCSNLNCCNPDHLMIGTRSDIHRVMRQNQRYRPRGQNIYQ